MHTWELLDTGFNTGAYNMRVDEDLLEQAKALDVIPVLRFYGWSPPAVSIGRFQKIERTVNVVACKELGIEIVRRVTGGRAVLHNRELTYSIVSRTDNPLFPNDILATYRVIASGLLAGFTNLGIRAEIVTRSQRYAEVVKKKIKNAACFSSASWYEIVVGGKKIAGSAQRRVAGAFLQHGSILIDYDPMLESSVILGECSREVVTSITSEIGRGITVEEMKAAFAKGFSETLNITFQI